MPHSVEGSIGGSVVVILGSIRNPDETDALSVELSSRDTTITLRADRTELGSWPSTAVTIRPIDSTSFEFIAEGDRLIFIPDDPDAFGDSPLVARDRDSTDEKRRFRRRTAVQEPSKEKPSKPSRQDRKAAAKVARAEAARAEGVPVPRSSDPGAMAAASDAEQPADDPAPSEARRRRKPRLGRKVRDPESDETPSKGSKEMLTGAWIRALDTARRYDMFGLDRVPIDEGLRGQEHEHTWDHRVAVSSGVGKHVCTICGKIRR